MPTTDYSGPFMFSEYASAGDISLFSDVTDNTLLPFGQKVSFSVDRSDFSETFSLGGIFENGIHAGSQELTDFKMDRLGQINVGDYLYITPFASGDSYTDGHNPDSGVFLDFNEERDSVVITWNEMKYSLGGDDLLTYQAEIIDRGDGDAEIIFRHADLYDPPMKTYLHYWGMGVGDGPGSELVFIPNYELASSEPSLLDLGSAIGNAGVQGVWHFHIIDGAVQFLVPSDDEVFEGSAGNDLLVSDGGNDTLNGYEGDDTLAGGSGNDLLSGGADRDILNGNEGVDTLDGGQGEDTIEGGRGDDFLSGDGGNDLVRGDAGDDTLQGGSGNDTLEGGSGRDSILGGDEHDSISGGSDHDYLRGEDGADWIDGGDGSDTIFGGDGEDTITGGRGRDSIEGGAGDDLIVEVWNTDEHGSSAHDIINGHGGNDTIDGARGSDRLGGQAGDDVIRGSDGNDKIGGGAGNDVLSGGSGNDWFSGGAGDDFIYGDTGWNHANGGAGADTFLLTPDGHLTVYNFNAAEGDRLIVDGDRWERGDFYLRTDADAQIVGADNDHVVVEATILYREGDSAPFREIAEIRSLFDMDSLRLDLPSANGEVIDPIVWDLA
ncbi:calcium-binding protein [Lutimaribacter marinistellae]|uniref:Calcium-binding protein n=1 Tax=Lutimaribacter marinistellae TaxID=1820329 RepID=A0ABV7TH18_9RHOB